MFLKILKTKLNKQLYFFFNIYLRCKIFSMFNRHQTVGEREICSYVLQMASLLFAPPRSRSSCILSDYYHIFLFVQLNQIDEDLGVFLHLYEQMQSRTDCICVFFLHSGF